MGANIAWFAMLAMKTRSRNFFSFSAVHLLGWLGLAWFTAASLVFAADLSSNDRPLVMLADLTKEGRAMTPPDREHPVYYRPVFYPYATKGPMEKDWEVKPANESELRVKLAMMLAAQGYLPANEQHPPTLVISFEYGTIAPNVTPDKVLNADEIRATVLGARAPDMNIGANLFGAYTRDMATMAARHYLVICAFRYQPGPHKSEVRLWEVHTSGFTWGNYLQDVMPDFIALAANGVGRDIAPGTVFKSQVPQVKIGESTVVPELR